VQRSVRIMMAAGFKGTFAPGVRIRASERRRGREVSI
jgi:hypothetical protein